MKCQHRTVRGARPVARECAVPNLQEEAMPLATLRQVLGEAAKGGYGVGAFNVNNMEQLQGIVTGAQEVHAPVIVHASRGAISYAGPEYLRTLVLAAVDSAPDVPIVLHL